MPAPNPAALNFLLTRQSRPARLLTAPVPDRDGLLTLLTAAARVPDHGKLVPWRFIVLGRAALDRLAALAQARGVALGIEPEKIAKAVAQYRDSPLAVAVIAAPKSTDRIPAIEQAYSAGAACLSLVNAATAAGWGANWLTGWQVYDPTFLQQGLALGEGESVAGIIHIGTATADPPDRPRPDLSAIVTWAET